MTAFLGRSFRLALLLLSASDPVVSVAPDRESGVYAVREPVLWTVEVRVGGAPAAGAVRWVVRPGGLGESEKGTAELADGKVQVKATRSTPGALLLEVRYRAEGAGREVVAYGGAVFDPDRIAPSAPPPEDFDAFWKAKIAELQGVPMNAQVVRVETGDPSVEYFKVTMNNIRGSKIHGQLAKPAGKTGFPALLQVQWAGVYPLQREWVLGPARNGWLAFNLQAHDLPVDEAPAFYEQKSRGELNDYPGLGNDDREKSYFLRMFLSCHRAVEFLTRREDWNGKAVVVHGGSQGGYQAIVTAGLHPAVTALAANVPAGCDHTGRQAGRAPGWPNWASRTWQKKDAAKMLETARYFDAMNFAPRVRCPALVGVGLIDTVCPPEGILAAVNQFKGPKKVVLMPRAGHGGDANAHQAYYALFGRFLEEHKKGPGK